ncbi:MAG: hypothetical protein JRI68_17115 [Deltaproteobacteria bacterium]|nr:hypothetical protein [Deltaproteobacteria bacterium]
MRPTIALVLASATALCCGTAACTALLGNDFTVVGDGGGGGNGTGGGGTGGTTTSSQGGGGGQEQGDFAFAILPTSASVPYEGTNFIAVEVTRTGDFTGGVHVSVQGAPPGFVTAPLTIAADATAGQLEVGASGTLVLGTEFDLELLAESGDLVHSDSVPAIVTGTPGTLDSSFGTAGLAAWQLGTDGGELVAIREVAQDKILVAGHKMSGLGAITFAGARLLPDGTLDSSFDGDGTVGAQFCGCTKTGMAVGVSRAVSGNVYYVGWASQGSGYSNDVALLRLKDDGTPDDDVAHDDGQNLFDLGTDSNDIVLAMEPDSNDLPTLTGEIDGQLFVARIGDLQWGGLDNGYAGGAGYLVPSLGGSVSVGQAIAIDSAGNAVVAGFVDHSTRDLVILRVTPSGVLDGSFATGGVFELTQNGTQTASGVAIEPDGAIVVTGITDEQSSNQNIFVLRLTPAGTLDADFGMAGMSIVDTPEVEEAAGIALMLDGRILVAGNGNGPLIARFLGDGSPDPTFGTNGRQAINLGVDGRAGAITVSQSGMTLLAGARSNYPTYGVVARIWN